MERKDYIKRLSKFTGLLCEFSRVQDVMAYDDEVKLYIQNYKSKNKLRVAI